MALDPRLAPGGIAELRADRRRAARGRHRRHPRRRLQPHRRKRRNGPTLSLRGLDNRSYYRHDPTIRALLVNDTGTGNTLACDQHPAVSADPRRAAPFRASGRRRRLPLRPCAGARPRRARLRSATRRCCRRSRADPVLGDRVLIAEPWDIGPGGYQLGNFPPPFLEWNDRFRDDVRRFWRGDRRHDRRAGDAARRLVRYLPQASGQATTRTRQLPRRA